MHEEDVWPKPHEGAKNWDVRSPELWGPHAHHQAVTPVPPTARRLKGGRSHELSRAASVKVMVLSGEREGEICYVLDAALLRHPLRGRGEGEAATHVDPLAAQIEKSYRRIEALLHRQLAGENVSQALDQEWNGLHSLEQIRNERDYHKFDDGGIPPLLMKQQLAELRAIKAELLGPSESHDEKHE